MRSRTPGRLPLILAVGAALPLAGPAPTARAAGTTELVSVGSAGQQGDGGSYAPSVSGDGRYVAFTSVATNLVEVKGRLLNSNIYRRDRRTGTTVLVDVSTTGAPANNFNSVGPSISRDGRRVAFQSDASNLAPGDTNRADDVFVRDIRGTTTRRVSLGPNGRQGNAASSLAAFSATGRFVAFSTPSTNLVPGLRAGHSNVYVRDLATGVTTLETPGADGRGSDELPNAFDGGAITPDGRFLVFVSLATNLVAGGPATHGRAHIYYRDRKTGRTRLVSVAPDGEAGDASSANSAVTDDGRTVAFDSAGTNLVLGDTNDIEDVFLYDRATATTRRVSVGGKGQQGDNDSGLVGAALSADGRVAAFESSAANLVPHDTNGEDDIFVRVPAGAGVTATVQ